MELACRLRVVGIDPILGSDRDRDEFALLFLDRSKARVKDRRSS